MVLKFTYKICFLIACYLLFMHESFAQTNLSITSTPTHSGGGVTTFGPTNYNDLINDQPNTTAQPWGWVSSNGSIELTWSSPQNLDKIVFQLGDRPYINMNVEYWNGSSFVLLMNRARPAANVFADSFSLSTPIFTSILRFSTITGSNPNFREIQVYYEVIPYVVKFTAPPLANYAYDSGIDTVWANSPYTFVNTSFQDSVRYWDIKQITSNTCLPVVGCYDYSTVFPADKNFRYTFTQTGTYQVRLVVRNPIGTDSITKTIVVANQTKKPLADFYADRYVIGQQNIVPFYDFSKNGPTQWMWSVKPTSVSAADTNKFNPSNAINNPIFAASDIGLFDVCLKASNPLGADSVCKTGYIEVQPGISMCGAANTSTAQNGFLYSNAGPLNSYNPATFNNTCGFLINPCAAAVNVMLDKLKLRQRDSIVLRDGGPTGTILRTFGGFNMPANNTVNAPSGKLHVQWKLFNNTAIIAGDTGFIIRWTAVDAAYNKPTARFTAYDTVYTNQTVTFTNQSTAAGDVTYAWDLNGDGAPGDAVIPSPVFVYTDTTASIKNVCQWVTNCKGTDMFCKNILVLPISTPPQPGITISKNSGFTTDEFQLNDVSKNGVVSRIWTITPATFSFLYGTNANSPNPIIKPNQPGWYQAKLVVTNNFGADSVIMPNFFQVIAYSAPGSELAIATSSDIGISQVKVADITHTSPLKTPIYDRVFEAKTATVFRGVNHTLEVSRLSAVTPMNRKAWIDINLDGDFNDAGEVIIDQNADQSLVASASFTIPNWIEPGRTIRLRIGVSEAATALTPDKATSGCFEDYALIVGNDFTKPSIALIGASVYQTEINKPFNDPGVSATDNLQGDISNQAQFITNLNTVATGFYFVKYFVTDLYGNTSDTIMRNVQVEVNQTGPVITLIGPDTQIVEVFSNYTDAGATAKTNNGTDITNKMIVMGRVHTDKIGTYIINYSVVDNFGFTDEANRMVVVVDTKAPVISNKYGTNTIKHQINTPYNDDLIVVADNYYPPSLIPLNRVGSVNSNIPGSYNLIYSACDPSNNCTQPYFVQVDVTDTIAPVVKLLGSNPITVNVFQPFTDPGVLANDNYYAPNSLIKLVYDSVNYNKIGKYSITYLVRDGAGNQTTLNRTVFVADLTPPVIELLGDNPFVLNRFKDYIEPGYKITDNYDNPAALQTNVVITSNLAVRNTDTLWGELEGWKWIRYQVKDSSGNTSELVERTVHIVPNTGLNNKNISNALQVFPNPSKGSCTIKADIQLQKPVLVTITNSLGQVVFNESILPTNNNILVNYKNLMPGLYFIHANINNHTLKTTIAVE